MIGVASLAGRAPMLAQQPVFGALIVVEDGLLPGGDFVAGVAFVTKQPFVTFVVIVFFVAAQTCFGRFTVLGGLVAVGTLDLFMLAVQGKACLAVVKPDLFPGLVFVAIGTLVTQRTLVLVVLSVTSNALQRCFTVLLSSHMALGTNHILVLAC